MATEPIDTAPLFGPLDAELVSVLRSLADEEWLAPTVAGHWRVRDVAAHLLDTSLRRVAASRDGHLPSLEEPIVSAADVSRLVNRLNASGVAFFNRLSTAQLVDLIAQASGWLAAHVATLPLHGRAVFPVSWAGEDTSEHWMDIGREYTERWHHQMQIRDATGRPLLLEPRWLDPLLDISAFALPVAYATLQAPEGTTVRIDVTAASPRTWTLCRDRERWRLSQEAVSDADCVATIEADAIWRLYYNALAPDEARRMIRVSGDRSLIEPLIQARSVVL
jgi:hypothetical protein